MNYISEYDRRLINKFTGYIDLLESGTMNVPMYIELQYFLENDIKRIESIIKALNHYNNSD
jgi:hypothetical protein